MKVLGVIPSRYASTRFPGKPLIEIAGKSMICRVYEQALKSKLLNDLVVATDDQRILEEVIRSGGKAVLTSSHHKNGTERCNEVAQLAEYSGADFIINIQGDEPFIDPDQIDLLIDALKTSDAPIATLIKRHPLTEEFQSASRVKVVVNSRLEALYFSRAVIPFIQSNANFSVQGFGHQQVEHAKTPDHELPPFYKHIGLYGYRVAALSEIVSLPESPLEKAESLEQLRWLENGYRIQCALTDHDSISIDIPADIDIALRQASL